VGKTFDKEQVKKFKELAKATECDSDDAEFERKLRRIVTVPTRKSEKPKKINK